MLVVAGEVKGQLQESTNLQSSLEGGDGVSLKHYSVMKLGEFFRPK